jgi:hypothetical protein
MISLFSSSAVDCGFEPRSGQTKDYEIGICCFSAKHVPIKKMKQDLIYLRMTLNYLIGTEDQSSGRVIMI